MPSKFKKSMEAFDFGSNFEKKKSFKEISVDKQVLLNNSPTKTRNTKLEKLQKRRNSALPVSLSVSCINNLEEINKEVESLRKDSSKIQSPYIKKVP